MRRTLLIMDEGKTAIRISQAASYLGWSPFVLPERVNDAAGTGDSCTESQSRRACAERILRAARRAGVSHVHPGRGPLSLDAVFARRCAREGLTVIGPSPGALKVIGDRT